MCLRVFVCLLGILGCCGVGIILVSDALGFDCAGGAVGSTVGFWCWWLAGFRLVFSGSLVLGLGVYGFEVVGEFAGFWIVWVLGVAVWVV